MKITKWHILSGMQKYGGSMSMYPFIDIGALPICNDLVSQGLAEYDHNRSEVKITAKGVAELQSHWEQRSSSKGDSEVSTDGDTA